MSLDAEQLSLPGVPLGRAEQWREHTAERWERDDPESYAECIQDIRNGNTNKTKLASKFARSRNSVQALMMKEFSVEQLREVIGKRALLVVGESMEKQDELIERAGVKELGSVAISGKTAFDIAQLANGAPTEIRETRHVLTVDDYQDYLAQLPDVTPLGTGSDAGKFPALADPLSVEAVPVPLGGNLPLHKEGDTVDVQHIMPGLMLVFMPVLRVMCDAVAWGFDRGGGG